MTHLCLLFFVFYFVLFIIIICLLYLVLQLSGICRSVVGELDEELDLSLDLSKLRAHPLKQVIHWCSPIHPQVSVLLNQVRTKWYFIGKEFLLSRLWVVSAFSPTSRPSEDVDEMQQNRCDILGYYIWYFYIFLYY